MTNLKVRPARKEDTPAIFQLIQDLATFEKAPNDVEIQVEQLMQDGFGPFPAFYAWIAETEDAEVIGFALVYFRYSTWKGITLYLEDLFVKTAYRRSGAASQLMQAIMDFGKAKGCKYLQWEVLEWNEDALAFYRKWGASLDTEWMKGRLTLHP
jgi:GNAT superfamily N-acetyltransferase